MLEDVACAAKDVGLLLHFGKTKIIHNGKGQDVGKTQVQAHNQTVEIVGSTDYLGTKLCLDQASAMEVEIDHRLARAWSKFATFRSELTNRKTNVFDRLRLFHAVITPCALYGCGSWSLKRAEEQKLRVAQRRMLRAVLGKGRRRLEQKSSSSDGATSDVEEGTQGGRVEEELHIETWISWLQRTTEDVKAAMSKLKMNDWVTTARQRQWSWACKVVSHASERWTARILLWQPKQGYRLVGRPRLRWLDPIEKIARRWSGSADVHSWIYLMANDKEAKAAMQGYIDYCSEVDM